MYLIIKQPTTSTKYDTACVSYPWNGTTYTTSGTKTWTGTNAKGCDSTAILYLTIKQPTSSTKYNTACVSYPWNGKTYSVSGRYDTTFAGANAVGCDSTATLFLTIKQTSSSTKYDTACVSYPWNGKTYSVSGTYDTTIAGGNAVGCDSTATLYLIIKQPTTSTKYDTACVSYLWNGTTYTSSGNYTYNYINENGCSSTDTLLLTILNNCNLTLQIKAYLQGFYMGNGLMYSSLYDLGLSADPTVTDSITINLWKPSHLNNSSPDISKTVLLHSDGLAVASLPVECYGKTYYIALTHRNSIETWSSNTLTISNQNSYDFTDNPGKVYSDNINSPVIQLGVGKYGLFGGDANHDGTADATDLQITENDSYNFAFGYNASDCNGDGASDALDMQMIENNTASFLFKARP